MKKTLIILLGILCIISCEKKNLSSEQVLKKFIEKRFKSNLNQSDLRRFFAGKLLLKYETIESLPSLKNLNYLLNKTKIILKNCYENKCQITYLISYKKRYKGQANYTKIEVKKIAILKKIKKVWKIVDIDEVKTYIENSKQLKI